MAAANGINSTSDFSDSAVLTGMQFFVDNTPTDALITGLSGTTYALPEPATLSLLALGGLAMIRRRRAC